MFSQFNFFVSFKAFYQMLIFAFSVLTRIPFLTNFIIHGKWKFSNSYQFRQLPNFRQISMTVKFATFYIVLNICVNSLRRNGSSSATSFTSQLFLKPDFDFWRKLRFLTKFRFLKTITFFNQISICFLKLPNFRQMSMFVKFPTFYIVLSKYWTFCLTPKGARVPPPPPASSGPAL